MHEKLQKEINRVTELLKFYEDIPEGAIGASMIRMSLKNAESGCPAFERVNRQIKENIKLLAIKSLNNEIDYFEKEKFIEVATSEERLMYKKGYNRAIIDHISYLLAQRKLIKEEEI